MPEVDRVMQLDRTFLSDLLIRGTQALCMPAAIGQSNFHLPVLAVSTVVKGNFTVS
jgi:hypothetical protein